MMGQMMVLPTPNEALEDETTTPLLIELGGRCQVGAISTPPEEVTTNIINRGTLGVEGNTDEPVVQGHTGQGSPRAAPLTTNMELFIWRPPASIFMQAYPEEVGNQCLCEGGHPVRRLRPV